MARRVESKHSVSGALAIFLRGRSVKRQSMASRDADDGGWQFLTGDAFQIAEAMLVTLKSMVARDQTLLELAAMQPGWMAWREAPDAPRTLQAEAQQTAE